MRRRAPWFVPLAFVASCSSRDESLGETRPAAEPIIDIAPAPQPQPVPNPDPDPDPDPDPPRAGGLSLAGDSGNLHAAMAGADAGQAWDAVTPEIREGTWIVIACFNEQGAVGAVVAELRELGVNVAVVDDGSREAGAHVLKHLVNRGQGAALQTGIGFALRKGARFVVTFDADGQHDPSDLPAMLLPIAKGEVEICLGSRFLGEAENMPATRRIMLTGAVIFTHHLGAAAD